MAGNFNTIPGTTSIQASEALVRKSDDSGWGSHKFADTKADVGLGNVDNTSDANKPVSTATQTALDSKENSITPGTSSQYYRGDKTFQTLDKTAVGLSNVDNTSDSNKPVSTATQTALDYKADTSSLATVATSGSYNDLSSKPTLGTAAAQNSTAFATSAQGTLADTAVQPGDLSDVATSGDYNDLSNKPTIPAAQVNSDWNATSGVSEILNKPTIPTVPVQSVNTETGNVVLSASDVGADASGSAAQALIDAKSYTDTEVANYLPLAGGEVEGQLTITYDPTTDFNLLLRTSYFNSQTAATGFTYTSVYEHIGGREWNDAGTYGLGLGYNYHPHHNSPVWIGARTVVPTSETTADFVVAIKDTTGNTEPIERLTVTPAGDVHVTSGYTPATDDSLMTKKNVEDLLAPAEATIPKVLTTSGTTTSGSVTFNLTSAGFTALTQAGCSFRVNDDDNSYSFEVTSLSNTSVTVSVKQRQFSGITLLGINVLGSTSMTAVSNGTTIYGSFIES